MHVSVGAALLGDEGYLRLLQEIGVFLRPCK